LKREGKKSKGIGGNKTGPFNHLPQAGNVNLDKNPRKTYRGVLGNIQRDNGKEKWNSFLGKEKSGE